MNTLPAELFHQIVIHLDQEQKIECMRVCRYWAQLIDTYSLFHTVRIASIEGFNKLIKKIQETPIYGTRMERLILHFNLPVIENKRIFILFPNLRVFYHLKGEHTDDEAMIVPWHTSLEFIAESHSVNFVKNLLSSGVCTHLISVSIDISSSDMIFPLLANAPVLKRLKLISACVTIDDLEILHNSTPSSLLQSIEFSNCHLCVDEWPTKIKPSPLVTHFKMTYTMMGTMEPQIQLLQYINEKYPNITKVTVLPSRFDIKKDELKQSYQLGWIPLYQSLGSQLKSLDVVQGAPPNLFQLLDDAGCQVEEIYLHSSCLQVVLHGLRQSKQVNYIRHMKLISYQMASENVEWLRGLSQLKTLKVVSFSMMPTQFLSLLEACPDSLESLSVKGHNLMLGLSSTRIYEKITSLSLCMMAIPQGFGGFLSHHFPKLNTLTLKNCSVSGNRLIMPNLNLRHFRISDCILIDNVHMLVETLEDGKLQWFTTNSRLPSQDKNYTKIFNVYDAPAYPPIKITPYEDLNVKPYLTLICHSVVNISMVFSQLFSVME